jgi:hypothetical protein
MGFHWPVYASIRHQGIAIVAKTYEFVLDLSSETALRIIRTALRMLREEAPIAIAQ